MKKLIFTLLIFSYFSFVYGQSEFQIPCAYDNYAGQLYKQYPEMQERLAAQFDRSQNGAISRSDEVYTINTVVHIVYQDSSQNLSDDRVYEVMEKITKDFMRQNEDADNVREMFRDRAASPNIQFNVHAIERVHTDATFSFGLFTGLPDHVKVTEDGGSDPYDPEKFMNLWVCNLEGGLLGYAYPPAGLYNWPDGSNAPEAGLDGVVVHTGAFNTFDTITIESGFGGGSAEVVVRGRTVTHEIGHYLGLRHIWGDGLAVLGIPACDEDDGIEDTPNQGLPSDFQCDFEKNTCIDGEDDELDMIENYMDYAEETCMNSFTQGQVNHMRSVLENERIGLIKDVTSVKNTRLVENPFQLFPNPASSYINIRLNQQLNDDISIEVYDYSGKKLLSEKKHVDRENFRLDISDLSQGMYLIKLTSGANRFIDKFIVL